MSSIPQLNREYTGISMRVMRKTGRGLVQLDQWDNVCGKFVMDGTYPQFTRTFPSGQVVHYGLHTPSQLILFALPGQDKFEHPDVIGHY